MNQSKYKRAIAFGLLTATIHAANLVQNGSFEAPGEPGKGYYNSTPTNWIGGALLFQGTNVVINGATWPSPEVGIQYEDIGNAASGSIALSQLINIPQTGYYALTWFDNEAFGYTHSYEILVNSNIVAVFSDLGQTNWTFRALLLNLSAGSNTLAFFGLGGYDTVIDNVDLESTVAPPQLTLLKQGTNIILTWPTNASGFSLQSTTNLGPSSVWIAVSPVSTVVNTNNTVTNTILGTQLFYRLSR